MNIFSDPIALIQGMRLEEFHAAEDAFYAAAIAIRRRLGNDRALIDDYIAKVLVVVLEQDSFEAANEGYLAYGKMTWLEDEDECYLPLNADEKRKLENATKTHARSLTQRTKYIPAQWQRHDLSIPVMLDIFAADFVEKMKNRILHVCNLAALQALYFQIAAIVGEVLLEQLNAAIVRRFLVFSPLDAYLHGFAQNDLYVLLRQDERHGRQVFRRILDDMEA